MKNLLLTLALLAGIGGALASPTPDSSASATPAPLTTFGFEYTLYNYTNDLNIGYLYNQPLNLYGSIINYQEPSIDPGTAYMATATMLLNSLGNTNPSAPGGMVLNVVNNDDYSAGDTLIKITNIVRQTGGVCGTVQQCQLTTFTLTEAPNNNLIVSVSGVSTSSNQPLTFQFSQPGDTITLKSLSNGGGTSNWDFYVTESSTTYDNEKN